MYSVLSDRERMDDRVTDQNIDLVTHVVMLKMIRNDFLVVKVNCLSSVFNIMKSILLLRNVKNATVLENKAS